MIAEADLDKLNARLERAEAACDAFATAMLAAEKLNGGIADAVPGHSHRTPGRWDGNGTICKPCRAWLNAKEKLAEWRGEVIPY